MQLQYWWKVRIPASRLMRLPTKKDAIGESMQMYAQTHKCYITCIADILYVASISISRNGRTYPVYTCIASVLQS